MHCNFWPEDLNLFFETIWWVYLQLLGGFVELLISLHQKLKSSVNRFAIIENVIDSDMLLMASRNSVTESDVLKFTRVWQFIFGFFFAIF